MFGRVGNAVGSAFRHIDELESAKNFGKWIAERLKPSQEQAQELRKKQLDLRTRLRGHVVALIEKLNDEEATRRMLAHQARMCARGQVHDDRFVDFLCSIYEGTAEEDRDRVFTWIAYMDEVLLDTTVSIVDVDTLPRWLRGALEATGRGFTEFNDQCGTAAQQLQARLARRRGGNP